MGKIKELEPEIEQEHESEAIPANQRLPFGFAQRFGVMISYNNDEKELLIKSDTPMSALLETRCLIGHPLPYRVITNNEFEIAIEQSYQRYAS